MKKIITSIALGASIALSAQSNFQIAVSRDQSISTSFVVSTMNVQFSAIGSHFTDALDQTSAIADPSFMYPYTIDSAAIDITTNDSRPLLRTTINVPFGAWTAADGNMFVQGSWPNPSDSLLYDVVLVDNQTATSYNFYNEVMIPVLTDVSYSNRFTIIFRPKAHCTAFDESCFGTGNGSIYAQSPQQNWTLRMYSNSVLVNTFNVANNDTLIGNLAAGNYELVYVLDNNAIDTMNVTVSGPAQIVASANISNTNPLVNDTVFFTNTSTGSVDYVWDFGDGFTDYTASPSHTYSTPGTYTVTLTAYNITGCDNVITYVINVQASMAGPQPDPNLNNRSNLLQNPARLGDANVQSVNGTAQLITSNDLTIVEFNVYSISGQLLFTGSGDVRSFNYTTPGVCILNVTYADGTAQSKQVMLN